MPGMQKMKSIRPERQALDGLMGEAASGAVWPVGKRSALGSGGSSYVNLAMALSKSPFPDDSGTNPTRGCMVYMIFLPVSLFLKAGLVRTPDFRRAP